MRSTLDNQNCSIGSSPTPQCCLTLHRGASHRSMLRRYRTYAVPQHGNSANSSAARTAHLAPHHEACSSHAPHQEDPTAVPAATAAVHSPPPQRGSALAALHSVLAQPPPAGRAACAAGQGSVLRAAKGDVDRARAGDDAVSRKTALAAAPSTAAARTSCTAQLNTPAGDALEAAWQGGVGVGAARVVADCGRRSTLPRSAFWSHLDSHLGGSLVKLRSQYGCTPLHPPLTTPSLSRPARCRLSWYISVLGAFLK